MSHDFVDTRSHDIVDTMSHHIVDTIGTVVDCPEACSPRAIFEGMSNALSPRVRAMIINFDPTHPDALSVAEFCRSVKISRSVFYKIRAQAHTESGAALHPQSRAPKHPARRYGTDVVNELVRIRKQLKADGWDYGPRTIHFEAALGDAFPGGQILNRTEFSGE